MIKHLVLCTALIAAAACESQHKNKDTSNGTTTTTTRREPVTVGGDSGLDTSGATEDASSRTATTTGSTDAAATEGSMSMDVGATYEVARVDRTKKVVVLRPFAAEAMTETQPQAGREWTLSFDEIRKVAKTTAGDFVSSLKQGQKVRVEKDANGRISSIEIVSK